MKINDFKKATRSVTKKWKAVRKREERESSARHYRSEYIYSDRVYQTDVADEVIPKAYAKASDNGRLPAHARQIFYAARKEIQDRTDRPLQSTYFTQTLLPKYMNRHPETAEWWVVYDARGHLLEPHTDREIALGTLEVDEYLTKTHGHSVRALEASSLFKTDYPTHGPSNRYSAILFIEKEGFHPLFKEVDLANRYDLAIMSTKGQSVVAARRLVDELCAGDVPVLVLHDMDKEGFLISQRLTSVSRSARWADRVRYEFKNEINVIDLGLRLADVDEWGLESEYVNFKGGFDRDSIATEEEQQFLRNDQRVELNAFTSADFIKWIEGKLEEHGIAKLVPDAGTLENAYRRAYQIAIVNKQVGEIFDEAGEEALDATVPKTLAEGIRKALQDNPKRSWDKVLAQIVRRAVDDSAC
jgi:hypothetical protein